jgi:hypothetical protein
VDNEDRKPDQDDPAFIKLVRLGLELSTEVAGRGVSLKRFAK